MENGFYRVVTPVFSVDDRLPVEVRLALDDREFTGGAIEAPGRHVLRLTARDAAGNATTIIRRFQIDRTPPELTLSGVAADGTAPGAVRPSLQGRDENLRLALFWIDGYLWRNGLAVAAPGRHELRAITEDEAGNRTEISFSFTIAGQPAKTQPLTTSAIGAALPGGAKILLTKIARLGPDPAAGAAVFFADREGVIRFGLVEPGTTTAARAWVSPASFGQPGVPLPAKLAVQVLDLESDGSVEIVAQGPGSQGERMLILRWQGGAWETVGDFIGQSILCLTGGPAPGRPVVLVRSADRLEAWARTPHPPGAGLQFAREILAASAVSFVVGRHRSGLVVPAAPAPRGVAGAARSRRSPLDPCRFDCQGPGLRGREDFRSPDPP